MQVIDSIQPFRPGERAPRRLPPPPGPPPSPRRMPVQSPVARPPQSVDGMVRRPMPAAAPFRPIGQSPSLQPARPAAPPSQLQPPRPVSIQANTAALSPAPTVVQLPSLALPPAPSLALPKKRSFWIKALGVVGAIAFVGFIIATRQPFGQVLIMVYGIVAIKRHLPSRVTFLLALAALGLALVSSVLLGGQSGIPPSFASYAFLLLAIGAVALAVELREDNPVSLLKVQPARFPAE